MTLLSTKTSANALISTMNGKDLFLRFCSWLSKLRLSDYNFVRNGDTCEPAGPEPIPAGVCSDPDQTYTGSSGWRKIPGNNCEGGLKKDEKVQKKCSQGTSSLVSASIINVPYTQLNLLKAQSFIKRCA